MYKTMTYSPLLVIVGETGSGKSALAIQLAQRYNGELLCADSRTVYTGMDIGTAKPTAGDRALIPHFGLDLVRPDERFTAADFKRYALEAIADITARGKLPIMVGGTGLYIDAVLYDYQFHSPPDVSDKEWAQRRAALNLLTVEQLQRQITDQGLALPHNARNPRHLVRVLETGDAAAVRSELRPNSLVLGIQIERDMLRQRVAGRVEHMLAAGFTDEVQQLAQAYGWDCAALQAPGYTALQSYILGRCSLDEAKAAFIQNDMDLAKRQRTWFKRNKSIHWLATEDKQAEAVAIATTFLNK